jgi:hypothetical protein
VRLAAQVAERVVERLGAARQVLLALQEQAVELVVAVQLLLPPESTQALRLVVLELAAELLPQRLDPRGFWFMRLMERQPSRRPLLPLLLQQRRRVVRLVVLRPAVVAVVLAAVAAVVEPHVVPRQRLFPGSGRNSPERPWSPGTPWPRRKGGMPRTAAQAITRAVRFRPPATSCSPV